MVQNSSPRGPHHPKAGCPKLAVSIAPPSGQKMFSSDDQRFHTLAAMHPVYYLQNCHPSVIHCALMFGLGCLAISLSTIRSGVGHPTVIARRRCPTINEGAHTITGLWRGGKSISAIDLICRSTVQNSSPRFSL